MRHQTLTSCRSAHGLDPTYTVQSNKIIRNIQDYTIIHTASDKTRIDGDGYPYYAYQYQIVERTSNFLLFV